MARYRRTSPHAWGNVVRRGAWRQCQDAIDRAFETGPARDRREMPGGMVGRLAVLLARLGFGRDQRRSVDGCRMGEWLVPWRLIVTYLTGARGYAQSVARNHRSLSSLAELLVSEWQIGAWRRFRRWPSRVPAEGGADVSARIAFRFCGLRQDSAKAEWLRAAQRVNSSYLAAACRRRRKYDNRQTNPRSPVQRGAARSPKLRFPRPCSTVRPS